MSLNKFTAVECGQEIGLKIGCDELKVGVLTYPSVDSDAGKVLGTDGNGAISFQDPLTTTKDTITVTEYALSLGTGNLLTPYSLYQENGSFVHIYGTVLIADLLADSVAGGVSTISLTISIPDVMVYPFVADSIMMGGGGGYAVIGGVREICSVNATRQTDSQVKINYAFSGDLTTGASRTAFLHWDFIYEK